MRGRPLPKLKRTLHIATVGNKFITLRVPTTRATKPVALTLVELDGLRGQPGVAGSCAGANCVMRSPNSFPHEAIFCNVTPHCVFVVDKIENGRPTHMWWYSGNFRELTDIQDRGDLDQLLRYIEKNPFMFLKVPRNRAGQPPRGTHPQAPRDQLTERRRVLPRGAEARAIKAGLLKPREMQDVDAA